MTLLFIFGLSENITAVSAGLISPSMVIIVTLTAIASFVAPPLSDTGAIIRVPWWAMLTRPRVLRPITSLAFL